MPSSYFKKWWTQALTEKKRIVNYYRRILKKAKERGKGQPTTEEAAAFIKYKVAEKDFHRDIKIQKQRHWDNFLDKLGIKEPKPKQLDAETKKGE